MALAEYITWDEFSRELLGLQEQDREIFLQSLDDIHFSQLVGLSYWLTTWAYEKNSRNIKRKYAKKILNFLTHNFFYQLLVSSKRLEVMASFKRTLRQF